MPLVRLLYFSENQVDSGSGSSIRRLSDILSASNRNNKRDGLTGALIFDDQWFLQALEGERDKVWKTYERIHDDERHANVVIAELAEIETRTFGNWWMGLATRTAKTQEAFEPYLQKGRLDPRNLRAADMLTLMVSVARLGLHRDLTAEKAA
jgi:hypothetical protein